MKCCISGGNIIRILFLLTELFKFEIQKCGQILCAHKPYLLMPGHILFYTVVTVVCDVAVTAHLQGWSSLYISGQAFSPEKYMQKLG